MRKDIHCKTKQNGIYDAGPSSHGADRQRGKHAGSYNNQGQEVVELKPWCDFYGSILGSRQDEHNSTVVCLCLKTGHI